MSYLCTRVHLIWSTLHREALIEREWHPSTLLKNHLSKTPPARARCAHRCALRPKNLSATTPCYSTT
jgi:hypothetical protein